MASVCQWEQVQHQSELLYPRGKLRNIMLLSEKGRPDKA